MAKSIYMAENEEVRAELRAMREAAGLTQTDLAALFGRPQSFISMAERGGVRLDVVQVVQWCEACGTSFIAFAMALSARLQALPKASKAPRPPKKRTSTKS